MYVICVQYWCTVWNRKRKNPKTEIVAQVSSPCLVLSHTITSTKLNPYIFRLVWNPLNSTELQKQDVLRYHIIYDDDDAFSFSSDFRQRSRIRQKCIIWDVYCIITLPKSLSFYHLSCTPALYVYLSLLWYPFHEIYVNTLKDKLKLYRIWHGIVHIWHKKKCPTEQ